MARRLVTAAKVQAPLVSLYRGENVKLIRTITRERGEDFATLAYLDPPFMTQRKHLMEDGRLAFDDRWSSRASYLEELRVRLILLKPAMSSRGSVVIHLDTRLSHYAKVVCDEVFGEERFASEIIWRYRRWPSKTPNFQRVHDVLLRYRMSDDETTWNQLYESLAPSTRETWGDRKQQAMFDDEGVRVRSSSTDELSKGVPMGDVWDIGVIAPMSKERTGYPSQKPEALMARLVESLTNPGDTVIDPYCGSGSMLAAARDLGRHAIGIDSSPVAIEIASKRLGVSVGA